MAPFPEAQAQACLYNKPWHPVWPPDTRHMQAVQPCGNTEELTLGRCLSHGLGACVLRVLQGLSPLRCVVSSPQPHFPLLPYTDGK